MVKYIFSMVKYINISPKPIRLMVKYIFLLFLKYDFHLHYLTCLLTTNNWMNPARQCMRKLHFHVLLEKRIPYMFGPMISTMFDACDKNILLGCKEKGKKKIAIVFLQNLKQIHEEERVIQL